MPPPLVADLFDIIELSLSTSLPAMSSRSGRRARSVNAPLERSGTRSSTSGPKRAGEAFQFRALAETPVPPPYWTLSFGMRGRPP